MRSRIAVLASGSGSNLQALLEHLDERGEQRGGDVVLVVSNRRDAGALARARDRDIASATLAANADENALDALLREQDVDLVVLAGYLTLVPPPLVRRFRGAMLNVHPALLPAFGGAGMYGRRVHEAVLGAGARVSGVTVHFVDEVYDHGAIIAQWPVPVFEEDSADTLAARVLRVEHVLFPRVVDAVAADAIVLDDDNRVRGAFLTGPQGWAFSLPRDATRLTADIESALAR